jgi:hypothetical protein
MKTRLALLCLLSAAACGPSGSAELRTSGTEGASLSKDQLHYGGGRLLTGDLALYVIWYGKRFEHQQDLRDFVRDLNGSPYLGMLKDYRDRSGRRPSGHLRIAGEWHMPDRRYGAVLRDPGATGWHVEDTSSKIVRDALREGHFPKKANALYVVVPGADVSTEYAGGLGEAFHAYTTKIPGMKTIYAALGGQRDFNGFSHEIFEAVTDPFPDGWRFGEDEIADACADHEKKVKFRSGQEHLLQAILETNSRCQWHR